MIILRKFLWCIVLSVFSIFLVPNYVEASDYDLIYDTSITINNSLLLEFKVSEEIDLSSNKGNIIIEYFTVEDGNLVPLRNTMANNDLKKDKTWDCYLWNENGSFSKGVANDETCSNVVLADTKLSTYLFYGLRDDGSMNYIDIDWSSDDEYAVKITVINSNGYGQSKTIYSKSDSFEKEYIIPDLEITDASLTYDNSMKLDFKISRFINLSEEDSDIKIEYFKVVNNTFIPLRNTILNENLVKNKLWDGYLWSKIGSFSKGLANVESYNNLIIPNLLLSTLVKPSMRPDMNYVNIDWDVKATYAVIITVSDGIDTVKKTIINQNPGKPLSDLLDNADQSFVINLEDDKNITADNIKSAIDKKLDLTFNVLGSKDLLYSWSFKGNELTNLVGFNIGININSSLKKETIDKLNDNKDVLYLSFNHHGELPSKATIKLYVGDKYKNSELLDLFYFNEETNKIEKIKSDLEIIDGYVTFDIDHCSEYFLQLTELDVDVIKEHNNPETKDINMFINSLFSLLSLGGLFIVGKKF